MDRSSDPRASVRLNALFAFSFANLVFLRAWQTFFGFHSPAALVHETQNKAWIDLAALISLIVAVSVVVYGLKVVYDRLTNNWMKRGLEAAFLLCLALILNSTNPGYIGSLARSASPRWAAYLLLIGGMLLGLTMLWKIGLQRIALVIGVVVLILFPAGLILVGNGIYRAVQLDIIFAEQLRPEVLPKEVNHPPPGPRVVFVLFDEFDYHLAFENRPVGVELPEFDRLRAEALVATNANPPADFTHISVPSMLLGRALEEIAPTYDGSLNYRTVGSEQYESLSNERTIFDAARDLGARTAVVGYFVPYARFFAKDAEYCLSLNFSLDALRGRSFLSSIDRHVIDVVSTIPFLGRRAFARNVAKFNEHINEQATPIHLRLASAAESVVGQANYDFVYLHMSIPHPPAVLESEVGRRDRESVNDYFANLNLADATFRTLRERMEKENVWNDSWVIVTSDHYFRRRVWEQLDLPSTTNLSGHEDLRIPLLIKAPHQENGLVYGRQFNTVVIRNLLPSMLNGELKTSEEVGAWLDIHGQTLPTYQSKGENLH